MEQTEQLMVDTARRLFADLAGSDVVNVAESTGAPQPLDQAILDSGLALAWVPEASGGVGGSLELGFSLIKLASSHALPSAMVDTLVANLMLSEAGLTVSDRWAALAYDGCNLPSLNQGEVNGEIESTFGARSAAFLVVPVLEKGAIRIATFAPSTIDMEHHESLAGEARSRIYLRSAIPGRLSDPVPGMTEWGLKQFGALVRACQIAGALEKIADLTVAYVKERHQFGRSLGRFQAIQHKVADLVGESALAGAAVQHAVRSLVKAGTPFGDNPEWSMAIATAKVVASEAAGKVARDAHQAHGAMGFSFEYPLQQYSRRVWTWREEFGSEFYWAEQLGQAVAGRASSNGAGAVWEAVSE